MVQGSGVDAQIVTPSGGRPSLVARIAVSEPGAPSLCLAATPDEESGGAAGMKALLDQHADLAHTDYAVTEVGGAVRGTARGPVVEGHVADKGIMSVYVTVRGTSGHSSMPYGMDNALVKAAHAIQCVAEYQPRQAHAGTRGVFVPSVVRGADRVNTIPGTVTAEISVRILPGDDHDEALDEVRRVLRGLVDPADVTGVGIAPARSSTDTPLWTLLERIVASHHPGGTLVPTLLPAQTDARYLRPPAR